MRIFPLLLLLLCIWTSACTKEAWRPVVAKCLRSPSPELRELLALLESQQQASWDAVVRLALLYPIDLALCALDQLASRRDAMASAFGDAPSSRAQMLEALHAALGRSVVIVTQEH